MYKRKGSARLPTNYRPISLLHPISRIFEHRIALCLSNFLVQNNILSTFQFAYVPERSATDQLLLLTHQMARVADKNMKFDCVFLDFTKAFDKVHHASLISNLSDFVEQEAIPWFESYLCNRSLSVRLEDAVSERYELSCGVPQGSHLAPLLFLIIIYI